MTQSAVRQPAQRPCILVLEDEPFIALDLQLALEDEGAKAHIATTCEDAMSLLGKIRFDGAILDVNLGGGQTCEAAAARLRKDEVPFVLHTGDLDRQGEMLRTLKAKVIPKPTPAAHVARSVLELAERYG